MRAGEDGWNLHVRAAMAFTGYLVGDRTGSYIGYLESQHSRADTMGEANEHNITTCRASGISGSLRSRLALGPVCPAVGRRDDLVPGQRLDDVGTHEFKDPRFIPLAAIHLGYEF